MTHAPACPAIDRPPVYEPANGSRFALLLVLAALVRGAALWKFGGQLAADPDAYREIAGNLVAGRGFSFGAEGVPTAYRPPLYPCLLALLTWVTGGNDAWLRAAIGGVQCLLGTATVGIVLVAARRLGLGRAAWIAGLLVAVDPLLVYGTALVMTETLATFLAALLLCVCLASPSRKNGLAVGVLFGLCCLCRPTFWAAGFLAAIGAGFTAWRSRRSECSHPTGTIARWQPALAVALGTAVTVAPWVLRNVRTMGRPILTTTHGGYTLLLGHNPLYTQEVVEREWGTVWAIDADERWTEWLASEMAAEVPPVDPKRKSVEAELARDRWMSRRAWRYIRENPGIALRSSLTLVGRLWNISPLATSQRSLPDPLRAAIALFYLATFACALAGLVRLRKAEWPQWWPAVSLPLAFTAVHALYWADMRMRAPLVPVVVLLAARGVLWRRIPDNAEIPMSKSDFQNKPN